MNAKDLRTEAALGDRSNDGNTKYAQGGGALPCHKNKTYQDIGSNSLAKVDGPAARPCAVIGPDRVVPPPAATDAYHKKSPLEPWLTSDLAYRRPPEYPHKLLDYQHPSRNISPRQTFQENMQRIMVPPSFNAVKLKEDHNFQGEPNISQMRNNKLNVPTDSNTKYCDVPYTVNPITNDQKNVRNSDISAPNMNTVLTRGPPQGWPPSSSNIQPPKPFHQDLCQYPEYQNCAAPRPMVMARPHRTVHEETGPVYPDGYYQHGNIRFKPYPTVKERYPQTRYEYVSNYSNPFHPPPPFPSHKYDLQKPLPPHPGYPNYPQAPLKYLDSRMADPIMNGYQRSLNQQAAYNNIPYRNQVIHPTYGPVPGNCLPAGKYYPYPPEVAKSMPPNKLPYDTNPKLYPDYESNRSKTYPVSDAYFINEIARPHPAKGPVLPNYPTNVHAMPTHPYYRKEPLKGYEYSPHFRNTDHMLGMNGSLMSRLPSQFSPSAIAISPSDSNTSNDTNQTQGACQEDCGYVSQSSTASVRSMDSVINRIPPDLYRRYDHRPYGHIMKGSTAYTKEQSVNSNVGSKEKKDIDVRQFLQMWNEGEDEGGENNNKEVVITTVSNNGINSINATNYEATNQEQLYVLGLVNVPSDELGKYEHIQKVSKLPENIKGYNSIELLHQFEEVVESSNLTHYNTKSPTVPKSFHENLKGTIPMHGISIPPRPISPLDVEAKISQSVIHKEVGCNFEIKPCSPKMLNVEVATPVPSVIDERMIEKVSNPHMNQPPIIHHANENRDDCKIIHSQSRLPVLDNTKIASCKMINIPYGNKDPIDSLNPNYSIQDLESNSGVCLASLPRLDNDIELHFPEVNQQFINANKVESVITSAPIKDLPPLEVEQNHSVSSESEKNTINSATKINQEKDFSKLSKYRKLKRKSSEPNTPESSVQALRTDSVIIKNPDNCKHDNMGKASPTPSMPRDAQNNPINLSISTEHRENSKMIHFGLNNENDVRPNDFAIDFSINSNESCSFTNVKVPEISPTEKDSSNSCNNVKKESEKGISRNSDQTQFNTNESFESEEEFTKPEDNKCDLNTQATCNKESFDILKFVDKSKDSSKIHLQKAPKFKHTDKDELNKKMSSYNLLSSQEKEDTLNEKMRELFGEEFSTVEAESDLHEVHDTQASLNDESDQMNKEETSLSCAKSDHYEEMEDSAICMIETLEKRKDNMESSHKNVQNMHEDCVFEKREEGNLAVQSEMKEQKLSDTNSCIVQHKRQCHSKKLLSPWIQKLIVHDEGSCAATTADLSDNYHIKEKLNTVACSKIGETIKHGKNDIDQENDTCSPVIKTINDYKDDKQPKGYTCIDVSETVNREYDYKQDNDTHAKYLQAADGQEIEEKCIDCNKLENSIVDESEIENNELCCELVGDIAQVFEKNSDQSNGKDLENNVELKRNSGLAVDDSNKIYNKLTSDTAAVLETDDAHETDDHSENCEKIENVISLEVFEEANENKKHKIMTPDTTNIMMTTNAHENEVHWESNQNLKDATNSNFFGGVSDNRSFETLETMKINTSETSISNNIDENTDKDGLLPETFTDNIDKNTNKDKLLTETFTDSIDENTNKAGLLAETLTDKIDENTNKDELLAETFTDSIDENTNKDGLLAETLTDKIDENTNKDELLAETFTDSIDENTNKDGLLAETFTEVLGITGNNETCGELVSHTPKVLEISNDIENCEALDNHKKAGRDSCVDALEEVTDNKSAYDTANVPITVTISETGENIKSIDDNTKVSETNNSVMRVECNTMKVLESSCSSVNILESTTSGGDLKTEVGYKSDKNMTRDTFNKIFDKTIDFKDENIIIQHKIDDEAYKADINDVCGKNLEVDSELNLNKQVSLTKHIEIVSTDGKLDKVNCYSNSSRWSLNHTPSEILSPLTPDEETEEIHELSDNNSSQAIASPLSDEIKVDTDNLAILANDYSVVNKDNLLPDSSLISEKIECVPLVISTTENKETIRDKPKKTNNFVHGNQSETLMVSMPDNMTTNESRIKSDHNKQSLEVKASKSVSCKPSNDDDDDEFNKMPQTNNNKPISENTLDKPNTINGERTACGINEADSLLEELSSCSDVSDDTSSSDYDNTSESGSPVSFQNKEETDKSVYDGNVANPVNDDESKMIGEQECIPVQDKVLIFDKETCTLVPSKEEVLNKTHENVNSHTNEDCATSNIQNFETESFRLNVKNSDEDVMNSYTDEPLTSDDTTSLYRETETSKDCSAHAQVESLEEFTETVSCSQDLRTTDDTIAGMSMNDSGIILETLHEETNYELLEDTISNEVPPPENSKNIRYSTRYLSRRRKSLKRSLSDSALDDIRDNLSEEPPESSPLLWPNKRKKGEELNDYNTSQLIAENICHVLQNRRNSVSSIHNEGNVSFCILIDNNCIISEECDDSDKICFTEVPEDCLGCIQEDSLNQENVEAELVSIQEHINSDYCTSVHTDFLEDDRTVEDPWVEDVACVETVISDDIAENIVISASTSPKDDNNHDETELYNINEHTDKLKYIYGDKIYNDDDHFVDTLYRTPQMNVDKTLNNREAHITDDSHIDDGSRYYDKESLERVLSESNVQDETTSELVAFRCRTPLPSPVISEFALEDNDNIKSESCSTFKPNSPPFERKENDVDSACHIVKENEFSINEIKEDINSCESSIDDMFNYKKSEESPKCSTTSSSPEVSSTTSEERNSSILLKITNYGGSRMSQVSDINPLHRISCKYTEKKDYLSSNGNLPTKTLITKGAQKYIPPLKETIPDLKVKLSLPQQSLLKLKQLKLAKDALKQNVDRPTTFRKEVPKKPKPKFEDVLKSIDEIQYQKHKEKNKKGRKSIPKVVIKKNEHGSHYASTSSKHKFNPDLTGMKWQPWVFLEKDRFIDKMALRKKTRAIFSHRKNSYVLAEKFQKYKSICNTKFVISQPKQHDSTTGHLKYTIRLKHSY